MSVRLIVGLGNPGPKYANNRHNVGYQFVDSLTETYGLSFGAPAIPRTGRGWAHIAGQRVLLTKPLTFMNLSGNAVGSLMHFYKLQPSDSDRHL